MLLPFKERRRHYCRGVTLLELLAAVGIVLTLAALLFPLVDKVRDRALIAKSSANLRTIGQAYHSYMSDHSMRPPEPLSYYIDNQENRTLWEWDGWEGIGFGKLQYGGYLNIPAGVAPNGSNRSAVFINPDKTRRSTSKAYQNWSDYSYLLTGRYSFDVWSRSSVAIAADVAGGVNISFAPPDSSKKPQDALVLYADGSTSIVPYDTYHQEKYNRTADGFDRDAKAP